MKKDKNEVRNGGEIKFCNKVSITYFVSQLALLGYTAKNTNYLYELDNICMKNDTNIPFMPVIMTIINDKVFLDFYLSGKDAKSHNVIYTITLEKTNRGDE